MSPGAGAVHQHPNSMATWSSIPPSTKDALTSLPTSWRVWSFYMGEGALLKKGMQNYEYKIRSNNEYLQ